MRRRSRSQPPARREDPQLPSTSTATEELPLVHGYLDGVVRGEAIGWCWRPSDPASRVRVDVLVDGEPVGSAWAELMREKVASAGFGDGRYGYKVRLPATLADGGSHSITVHAEGVALTPSPTFGRGSPHSDADDPWANTTFKAAPVEGAPAPDRDGDDRTDHQGTIAEAEVLEPSLRGYVDGVLGSDIMGWIVDENQHALSIPVEAYIDGVFIGSMTADASREDVNRAGYGARHGFRFPLPAPLEPGEYVIEVRTTPDGWRVPLISDYAVLDANRRAIDGITLREPRITRQIQSGAALLGRDGWLFEWPGTRVFHILRGQQPMPPAVFERQHARILARRETARAAGAVLIEAVVPAKLAVYDDFLPAGLEIEDTRRPASQLAAAIRDENGVDLLDLTVPLRQVGRRGPVFSRTGHGLTWLGGFSAYRVLAKELAKFRPELEPLLPGALELDELEQLSDSLADLPRMVWVGSGTVPAGPGAEDEEHEGQPRLDRRHLTSQYAVIPPELLPFAGSAAGLLRRRGPDRGADALVIHDGSATTLAPFLAEHFDRTLVVANEADVDELLKLLRPEAVIEVVAERSLLLV